MFKMDSEKLQSNNICLMLKTIEAEEIQKLKISLSELYSVWNEIGLNEDQLLPRFHTAWDHIHTLTSDILSEEISLFEDYKEKVKLLSKSISDLSTALSVPTMELTGSTLVERVNRLEEEFDFLNKLKEKRMQDLRRLRLTEKNYCDLLAVEELRFSSEAEVPSESDLKELEQHIDMLVKENNLRHENYRTAQKQLFAILKETEISPESTFEKHFFSGKEPLSLSADTFMIINSTIDRVKKRKCELEEQKDILLNELITLWRRLNLNNDKFLSDHQDFKTSTLKSIQQEIEKCKKNNMSAILCSLKEELNNYWYKCGVSKSERELFYSSINTEDSEEVLIAYENEVQKIKKYYNEIKPILNKIEKRNKLWDLLKYLDAKANDPERFKNRGGTLLREEKERNMLLKTLPSLENQIDQDIEKYELETCKKFFFNGEEYRSVISKQWEERPTHKENLKLDNIKQKTPAKQTRIATPKSVPSAGLAIYRTPSAKSRYTPMKRTIKKRDMDIKREVKAKCEQTPLKDDESCSFSEKELISSTKRSSVLASKKIGGTRTVTPSKSKKKMTKKL